MNKILILIAILVSTNLYSQWEGKAKPLKTIDPMAEPDDLNALDHYLESASIIGIGESTHGTSEFTTMRHRIFRYLVEKHHYNTFFLEADFSATQRINRYIHGETDTASEALYEVQLWPWRTAEMIKLIEWMRSYNETHQNVLNFIGCDMQLLVDDLLEWNRFFIDDTIRSKQIHDILSDIKSPKTDTIQIRKKYIEWMNFRNSNPVGDRSPNQIMEFKMMDLGLQQWFEHKLCKGENYNFRDSCMAVNIQYYMNLNPNTKGIYFAHNGHSAKAIYSYGPKYYDKKSAGGFLSESMKDQYKSIGLLTTNGSFHAINWNGKAHNMESFILKSPKRNSIEYKFKNTEADVFYIDPTELKQTKNLSYTSVGAIFGRSYQGYKVYRYSLLKLNRYDLLIMIKDTHPTDLLDYSKSKGKK